MVKVIKIEEYSPYWVGSENKFQCDTHVDIDIRIYLKYQGFTGI